MSALLNIEPCFYCEQKPEHRTKPAYGPWLKVTPVFHQFICVTPECFGQRTHAGYFSLGRAIANWNQNVMQKHRIVKNAINTAPPLWRSRF